MNLLGILGNKYVILGIILVVLLGGGLVYINVLKDKVDGLSEKNNALTTLLSVSQASVKSLKLSIDEQNSAFEKLRADAAAREKAGLEAIAKARAETATAKKRAVTIISAKIPEGKTACDAANDLFNEEIKNAK